MKTQQLKYSLYITIFLIVFVLVFLFNFANPLKFVIETPQPANNFSVSCEWTLSFLPHAKPSVIRTKAVTGNSGEAIDCGGFFFEEAYIHVSHPDYKFRRFCAYDSMGCDFTFYRDDLLLIRPMETFYNPPHK